MKPKRILVESNEMKRNKDCKKETLSSITAREAGPLGEAFKKSVGQ